MAEVRGELHRTDRAGGHSLKPTFLFIGPDKTGSTWLYEVLRQHPLCYVPPVKDIYFFDRHYDRGLDWYLKFFEAAPEGVLAAGELSHDYLFSPQAADRIAHDLPEVKLLTSLRDPAERAFSHYLYMIRSGRTRLDFTAALERFPELIENSRYFKHLSAYLDRFKRDRILVLYFDALQADPRGFASDVFNFIGIPAADEIDFEQRVLPAARPRNFALARALKTGARLARGIGMTRLVGMVKRGPMTSLAYRPYTLADRPQMDLETRMRLVETLRPEVEKLESALDVDLSRWLQVERAGTGQTR